MKGSKLGIGIIVGVVLLAAAGALLMVGLAHDHEDGTVYWCPMHPFYKVRKPGICPYCNMALEEYTGRSEEGEPVLVLTDHQVQQGGVRTEQVERRDLTREILTSGILEKSLERFWHVHARFQGWVEEFHVDAEGETVRKGQPIARIFSPELYSAQEEYLLAKDDPVLQKLTRQRLELFGIGEQEINELERRGKAESQITLRSPYDGVVVRRHVTGGMKIPPNGRIMDIADLSELWIYADIYDRELSLIRIGQEARIQLDAFPGESFTGKVDLIEPLVRASTQAARVRIRVPNDPVKLLPGQFTKVLLLHNLPKTLSVSEHAVIPTGRRDIVIVARGGGRFVAREVRIGQRALTYAGGETEDRGLGFFTGHRRYHEVTAGLEPGEDVVTAGVFLLHAETQIRGLLEKMLESSPVHPMQIRSDWSGTYVTEPVRMKDLSFADAEEHDRYMKNPDLSWNASFPRIEKAMAEFFKVYFLVHGAIVEGKGTLASEYTESVSAQAETMKEAVTTAFAEREAGLIRAMIARLEAAAEHLHAAGEDRTRQRAFGEMSSVLEDWIKEFGPPVPEVSQFYCGMARGLVDSPTGRWFQREQKLRNPFGMQGCGSLEKVIRRGGQ